MKNYRIIKGTIILIGIIILFCRCNPVDEDLKMALSLAGNNRGELEKVLAHYSAPEDSLKYKAAVFLIRNMPYHSGYYSEKFERYDAVSDSMYSRCHYKTHCTNAPVNKIIRQGIFQQILDHYKERLGIVYSSDFRRIFDIEKISAELLTENIDYAFKAWGFSWSRHYSFEQFCQYILPYRYGQEPLESWRPYCMKQLSWVLDSVNDKNSSVEVATFIERWLAKKVYNIDYFQSFYHGGLKCSNFIKSFATTSCDDRAGLCASCFRAMGIPTVVVSFPKWGKKNQGHSIIAVLNDVGGWYSFRIDAESGINDIQLKDYKVPKIFIKHYNFVQPDIDSAVYQRLSYLLYSEDITSDYIKTTDIELDIDPQIARDHKYAFICVFDRPNWEPVFWGKIKHGKVKFRDMGTGMVYLPVIYSNNTLVPLCSPVKVDSDGHVQKIQLNKRNETAYSFNRKFPVFKPDIVESRCEDMVGGRFESADNKSFKNSKIIYEIKDITPYYPELVRINPVKAKFVRYCFPKIVRNPYEGPGQIAFYTTMGGRIERLEGNLWGSSDMTPESLSKIFDNDILTCVRCLPYEAGLEVIPPAYIFYRGSGDSIWGGIEFDKEEVITHVSYCPRNDKNGIYPGMNYELFYWDKEWNSLGVEMAGDSTITYNNIPEGALLWLRNLDEGKDERICTIENGKLVWW